MSAKDFPRPGRRVTDAERASMLRVDQAGNLARRASMPGNWPSWATGIPIPD